MLGAMRLASEASVDGNYGTLDDPQDAERARLFSKETRVRELRGLVVVLVGMWMSGIKERWALLIRRPPADPSIAAGRDSR